MKTKMFKFSFNQEIEGVTEVYSYLEMIFGTPEESNHKFHKYGTLHLSNRDEVIQLFRVIVCQQEYEQIKEKIISLGYMVEDLLEAIQSHFHPSCWLGDNRHEGIAYESDNDWDVNYREWDIYYVEGSFNESFESQEVEKFFFHLKVKEIDDKKVYDFVCQKFEEKVNELSNKI
jgi:hypothetical protein